MSASLGEVIEPLRVLEILGNSIVGGMETYSLGLVRGLPPTQFRVSCICPFESPITSMFRQTGCRVFILPIADDPSWRSIQAAATLVKTQRIQVIHAHLGNAHILGMLASSLTGVPCLATIHGSSVSMPDFETQRAGNTHLSVVCYSAYWHALGLGVSNDNVHYIPNGVDCKTFKPNRPKEDFLGPALGLPSGTPLVGQVGRLAPEKGPEIFVRAAWLIHQTQPAIRFVLIGDGPLRAQLTALVRQLRLEKVVHFTGIQHQMELIYPSLDLLVSSSYTEGMPLALMEAMACGIPVIGTAVGGVPEIIERDLSGVLVNPGDAEGLAQAIMGLLDAPARLQSMGREARKRIEASFSGESTFQSMGELLCKLGRQPRSAIEEIPFNVRGLR